MRNTESPTRDALHVIRNPFRLIEQEGDYEGHLLIIGVDLGAR